MTCGRLHVVDLLDLISSNYTHNKVSVALEKNLLTELLHNNNSHQKLLPPWQKNSYYRTISTFLDCFSVLDPMELHRKLDGATVLMNPDPRKGFYPRLKPRGLEGSYSPV